MRNGAPTSDAAHAAILARGSDAAGAILTTAWVAKGQAGSCLNAGVRVIDLRDHTQAARIFFQAFDKADALAAVMLP